MECPDNLKYSVEHEWLAPDGTVGITAFAVEQIGDIVFVEVPAVGSTVVATKPFGVVESVKAVSDLFAPVGGEVIEANASLAGAPETVNSDPYGAGWMLRIRLADTAQLDALLDPAAYEALAAEA